MQAITKIVETREFPYQDSYFWKNNGNTTQRKTGCKSIYYKCSNSNKVNQSSLSLWMNHKTANCHLGLSRKQNRHWATKRWICHQIPRWTSPRVWKGRTHCWPVNFKKKNSINSRNKTELYESDSCRISGVHESELSGNHVASNAETLAHRLGTECQRVSSTRPM